MKYPHNVVNRFFWPLIAAMIAPRLAAQPLFRSEEIPVIVDGFPLSNAWAGGLNSCQFSSVDLNLDGKNDLFVFDRVGDRILCFINTGGPGQVSYDHEFSYTLQFPDSLRNWALMRDYNCDGKSDIFTNYSSGLRIYENESTVDDVEFTLRSQLTKANYDFSGTSFSAPVYCIGVDLPGIFDYDGDGDMDIITFTETAMTLYYYKNYGAEIGLCDSLNYECVNRCYGKFHESPESFTLFTGEDAQCDFNVVDPREADGHDQPRHTGGTVLNLDLDQNGVPDIVIGDVTEPNLAALEMVDVVNGQDSAVVLHMDFPATYSSTFPVNLNLFPGAFYEDVNNDGIRDLIVSPNAFANAEDSLSCWMYINQGQDDLPQFEFATKTFLQGTMIDLGTGALPVLEDIDGDGLQDLVVANLGYFFNLQTNVSKLWLFTNTGTVDNPEFTLTDKNFLDIPSHEWNTVYPAFADFDNDGDDDLVMGEQGGMMHFFRNEGGQGNPAEFVLEVSPMVDALGMVMDVGQFSTPQLIDVTGDDLPDLVVGEKNGNINLFENVGTMDDFMFSLVEDTIGNVVATNFLGINGYSVPHFFRNDDDELELLVGSETGQINHYNNIEGNFLGDFNLLTLDYQEINEGERSAVYTGDINGDGKRDLFLGNIGGGLAFYSGDTAEISIPELDSHLMIRIYPNPATDAFLVEWSGHIQDVKTIDLFDLTGRKIKSVQISSGSTSAMVEVQFLAKGFYVVQVGTYSQLLIKD